MKLPMIANSMGSSSLNKPTADRNGWPHSDTHPTLSYRTGESDRNSCVYNNQCLQQPSTPSSKKIQNLMRNGLFENIHANDVKLTSWPRLFFTTNLLFCSKPIKTCARLTFCLTSSWSSIVKYSKPGGQFGMPAGISIHPPGINIKKRTGKSHMKIRNFWTLHLILNIHQGRLRRNLLSENLSCLQLKFCFSISINNSKVDFLLLVWQLRVAQLQKKCSYGILSDWVFQEYTKKNV